MYARKTPYLALGAFLAGTSLASVVQAQDHREEIRSRAIVSESTTLEHTAIRMPSIIIRMPSILLPPLSDLSSDDQKKVYDLEKELLTALKEKNYVEANEHYDNLRKIENSPQRVLYAELRKDMKDFSQDEKNNLHRKRVEELLGGMTGVGAAELCVFYNTLTNISPKAAEKKCFEYWAARTTLDNMTDSASEGFKAKFYDYFAEKLHKIALSRTGEYTSAVVEETILSTGFHEYNDKSTSHFELKHQLAVYITGWFANSLAMENKETKKKTE